MLDVKIEGNKAIIDVREKILNGEHPRNEILEYVKKAPKGTVFEIHLPLRAEPLVTALTSLGMTATISELESEHFRIMAVKLVESSNN